MTRQGCLLTNGTYPAGGQCSWLALWNHTPLIGQSSTSNGQSGPELGARRAASRLLELNRAQRRQRQLTATQPILGFHNHQPPWPPCRQSCGRRPPSSPEAHSSAGTFPTCTSRAPASLSSAPQAAGPSSLSSSPGAFTDMKPASSSLGEHTATVFGATGQLGRYIVNRLGSTARSEAISTPTDEPCCSETRMHRRCAVPRGDGQAPSQGHG